MLIQINDSAVIAQAFILSAILRTDLVPVPVSLELELKYDDGLAKELIEGTTLYVGSKAIPLQIVKSEIKIVFILPEFFAPSFYPYTRKVNSNSAHQVYLFY